MGRVMKPGNINLEMLPIFALPTLASHIDLDPNRLVVALMNGTVNELEEVKTHKDMVEAVYWASQIQAAWNCLSRKQQRRLQTTLGYVPSSEEKCDLFRWLLEEKTHDFLGVTHAYILDIISKDRR